jgi:hypothetical protein
MNQYSIILGAKKFFLTVFASVGGANKMGKLSLV